MVRRALLARPERHRKRVNIRGATPARWRSSASPPTRATSSSSNHRWISCIPARAEPVSRRSLILATSGSAGTRRTAAAMVRSMDRNAGARLANHGGLLRRVHISRLIVGTVGGLGGIGAAGSIGLWARRLLRHSTHARDQHPDRVVQLGIGLNGPHAWDDLGRCRSRRHRRQHRNERLADRRLQRGSTAAGSSV